MIISALATGINPISQLSAVSSILGLSSSSSDLNTKSSGSPAISGKMMQSIMNSLSSMPSKSNNSNMVSNTNTEDSVHSFVEALLSALQSQQADGSAPVVPTRSHRHQGGMSNMEVGLQNLLNEISSSDSTQSQTPPSLKSLEQNANTLFSSMGIPTGDQSLTQLINNVKQYLAGSDSVGNLLSTTA